MPRGCLVGMVDGDEELGDMVGFLVGEELGALVGFRVGAELGVFVGLGVGEELGEDVIPWTYTISSAGLTWCRVVVMLVLVNTWLMNP